MKAQHPFLEGFESVEYVWCLHCERVYPKTEWVKTNWDCPGLPCDGGPFDAWPWNDYMEKSGIHVTEPEYGSYWPLSS